MRIHQKNIAAYLVFGLLIFCFFSAPCTWGATTTTPPDSGQFPSIQATSLDNAKLHLPQDFSGKLNLVVISFAREQQSEVDTWVSAVRQIQPAHTQLKYYELPTGSRENPLSRWWLDSALRSDTTDKDLRSQILTAYVNKGKFRQSLHIANEKQVVAVLVDRMGKIYWRGDGACTEQKTAALLSALAAEGI